MKAKYFDFTKKYEYYLDGTVDRPYLFNIYDNNINLNIDRKIYHYVNLFIKKHKLYRFSDKDVLYYYKTLECQKFIIGLCFENIRRSIRKWYVLRKLMEVINGKIND